MRNSLLFIICLNFILLFSGCNKEENLNNPPNNISISDDESNINDKIGNSKKEVSISKEDIYQEELGISEKELLFIFDNNLSSESALNTFGEPEKKSVVAVWEADGLKHQSWHYISKGIVLDMITTDSTKIINSIKITSHLLETSDNISVGSPEEEVLSVYKDKINIEDSNQDLSRIVVGSIYDGINFEIENDVVSSIFIGAVAE